MERTAKSRLTVLALWILSIVCSPAAADQTDFKALVIGNGAYLRENSAHARGPFTYAPLTLSRQDATGISQRLRRLGIDTTLLLDADKDSLSSAILDFEHRLQPGDTWLLYFSGHGVQIDGKNYAVPVNETFSSASSVTENSLDLGRVLERLMKRVNSKRGAGLMILDACRTPFESKETEIGGPRTTLEGFARMTERGAMVVYATEAGKVAAGEARGRNSYYTSQLIETLDGPKALLAMPASSLFQKIRKDVALATRGVQWPYTSDQVIRDFCFHPPCLDPAAVTKLALAEVRPAGKTDEPPVQGTTGTKGASQWVPETVRLPGGCFQMGNQTPSMLSGGRPEPTRVCVDGFSIGVTEVTFHQFDVYARTTGSRIPDDRGWGRGQRPAIGITWHEANAYVAWLSEVTDRSYRLPTEAEWEYAARAGSSTDFWSGQCLSTAEEQYKGRGLTAHYRRCESSLSISRKDKTIEVASLAPNPFGLFDMLGNVREWVCSEFTDQYGLLHPREQSCAPNGPHDVVVRGGSWWDYTEAMLPHTRASIGFEVKGLRFTAEYLNVGFRVVLDE